jgi:hypothetical protein
MKLPTISEATEETAENSTREANNSIMRILISFICVRVGVRVILNTE